MYVPNVTLPDKDARVVDRLGKAELEDLSLQPTLQEVLDLQRQHVIESHTGLVEHTNADKTADEGVTLEKTLGVLVIELKQLTGRTTDLGQDETDTPNLALVAKTVLAGELNYNTHMHLVMAERETQTHLQLGIKTSRLKGATGDLCAVKLSSER